MRARRGRFAAPSLRSPRRAETATADAIGDPATAGAASAGFPVRGRR